ncbi:helix-turn-helix domain-containing protein [Sagittula marina]|nr:helix-turn-helix domain-containing protein [Sagittula marina]
MRDESISESLLVWVRTESKDLHQAMKVDLHNHEQLKCRLRQAGSSMAEIARTLGIKQSSVTVVSQGYRRSHRVQSAIACQLGTTPQELFPDRYAAEEDSAANKT